MDGHRSTGEEALEDDEERKNAGQRSGESRYG